jgi:predicted Zn-dependent protease
VPGTNRERLNFVSSARMEQMGQQTFASLTRDGTVDRGPMADRVRAIGRRVVASAQAMYPEAGLPDRWEIVVLDDSTPNAFAVPGGRIGVHSGMIDLARSDDAIAIVIGHEVGHVLAEHAAERMSQAVLIAGGLVLGDAAMSDLDDGTRQVVMAALGAGASVGVLLPYSRLHESEADELGLYIAANAGFDPREAIPLWTRMGRSGGGGLEFLSTHPMASSRIERFRAIMPRAMSLYRRARDH